MFNARPPQPKYSHAWDVNLVFNHMRNLGPNNLLPFMVLSQKVAILLALLSGKRVHSISLLRKSFMTCYPPGNPSTFSFHISGCEKHTRPQFRGKPLKFWAYPEEALCPVQALGHYLCHRDNLSSSDNFFISTTKPYAGAHKDTIARWIKCFMKNSGVDTTVFSPHSCRSASTSAASAAGVSIDEILEAGDWTNATTFYKFYRRCVLKEGDEYANSILTNSVGQHKHKQ